SYPSERADAIGVVAREAGAMWRAKSVGPWGNLPLLLLSTPAPEMQLSHRTLPALFVVLLLATPLLWPASAWADGEVGIFPVRSESLSPVERALIADSFADAYAQASGQ